MSTIENRGEGMIPYGQTRQETATSLVGKFSWGLDRVSGVVGAVSEAARRTFGAPFLRVVPAPEPVQPVESPPVIDFTQERKKRAIAFLQEKANQPEMTVEDMVTRLHTYATPAYNGLTEEPLWEGDIPALRKFQVYLDENFVIRRGTGTRLRLFNEDPLVEQLKRDQRNSKRAYEYNLKKGNTEKVKAYGRDYLEDTIYLFEYIREREKEKMEPILEQVRTRTLVQRELVDDYLESNDRLDQAMAEDADVTFLQNARDSLTESYLEKQKSEEDARVEIQAQKSDAEVAIERIHSIPLDEVLRHDSQFQAALKAFSQPREVKPIRVRQMSPVMISTPPREVLPQKVEQEVVHYPEVKVERVRQPSFLKRHWGALSVTTIGIGLAIASLWGQDAKAQVDVQEALTPKQPQASRLFNSAPQPPTEDLRPAPAEIPEDRRFLEQDKSRIAIGSDPLPVPAPVEASEDESEYGTLVIGEGQEKPVWKYNKMQIPEGASPELREMLERRIARLEELVNFYAERNGLGANSPQFVVGQEWYSRDINNPQQREQIKELDNLPLEMEEYFDMLAQGILDES